MDKEIELIEGGIAIDDRGQLQFCNNFNFKMVKRFYVVSNHQPQFVRAWHAHKKEAKYIFVVSGAAIVAAVKIDNWEKPNREAPIHRYVLSDKNPAILKISPGYAHGLKTLLTDTKIIVFSSSTVEESKDDDIRYEADYWNPWHIEPR